MAEFNYFATLPESLAMLSDVLMLGMGLRILHDPGLFQSDQPHWRNEVDDELGRLFEEQAGFVLGGEFTWLPLGFHLCADGEPGFELNVAHGGPVLKGHVGSVANIEGVPTLYPGDLWYQPHYYNPISQTWDPPSEDLKDAYRAIVRRMKRHLIPHQTEPEPELLDHPRRVASLAGGQGALRAMAGHPGRSRQAPVSLPARAHRRLIVESLVSMLQG